MRTVLILASASPRRAELLRGMGVEFEVKPSAAEELHDETMDPAALCELNAERKAMEVAKLHPDRNVLGADTLVVLEGRFLGKPRDIAEAREMLRALGGKAHQVITGVCLCGPEMAMSFGGEMDFRSREARREPRSTAARRQPRPTRASGRRESIFSDVTEVRFRVLSAELIEAYLAAVHVLDKAGAYGIQERGEMIVESISGSFSNVVGLPVERLAREFKAWGIA